LSRAHQVLLVVGADLVGLWHARTALDQLERHAGVARQDVSLILNRFDAGHHHAASEVEWHLGAPIAAVVPFDHTAAQRAVADQRPLVTDPGSRAARALLALAEHLNQGKLRLRGQTPEQRVRDGWWRHLLRRTPVASKTRALSAPRGRAW
jgi:Flp pilus assembly CpaE family ATPase